MPLRDLAVGQAHGNAGEDVLLAAGEGLPYLRGPDPVGPAPVGTALVGTALVGTALVGTALVGTALVGTAAAGWFGRLGGRGGGELADQAVGGARGQDGVAGGDGVDGGDQLSGLGVLEQEAAGPGAQPGVNVVVEVEGGQDQDLGRQPGSHDVAGRFDAVAARHPDVHEHDVGAQRGTHGEGGRPVRRLLDLVN